METAFWEQFSECFHALDPHAEGADPYEISEKIGRWLNIYKFICRSNVYVDIPIHELREMANKDPMLKRLLKCNGDGKMGLEESEDPFPELKSNQPFECEGDHESVFFTGKDLRSSAVNHGVLNISMDTIWNQQNKFKDTGKSVRADKGWHWRTMEILKETSNSMVVVDNFVLAPDNRTGACRMSYSLKEMLRIMLPDSCQEDYILSIFYYDDSSEKRIREGRKGQFELSIKEFLVHQKKRLGIKLELFPTTANGINHHKDFHDRTVVTNNVWVGSEAGFDLLYPDTTLATNARAIKSTKSHGLYLGFGNEVADWLDTAYDNLIEEAKLCLKKYKYKTENRLLL